MATRVSNVKNFVCCLECSRACFFQWYSNPIVAYCKDRNERTVAEARRICREFTPSNNRDLNIVHFDHYEEGQCNEYINQFLKQ